METITVNKRDNNYEITMHKDFTNLTITKDKEYLEGLIKYIKSIINDKFEYEIKDNREEYLKFRRYYYEKYNNCKCISLLW